MQAADLGPVPDAEKTQSPVDLFLIIAGANLVATTLQTGASLAPAFGLKQAALLVGSGRRPRRPRSWPRSRLSGRASACRPSSRAGPRSASAAARSSR